MGAKKDITATFKLKDLANVQKVLDKIFGGGMTDISKDLILTLSPKDATEIQSLLVEEIKKNKRFVIEHGKTTKEDVINYYKNHIADLNDLENRIEMMVTNQAKLRFDVWVEMKKMTGED
jgi:hypothetical protein